MNSWKIFFCDPSLWLVLGQGSGSRSLPFPAKTNTRLSWLSAFITLEVSRGKNRLYQRLGGGGSSKEIVSRYMDMGKDNP